MNEDAADDTAAFTSVLIKRRINRTRDSCANKP